MQSGLKTVLTHCSLKLKHPNLIWEPLYTPSRMVLPPRRPPNHHYAVLLAVPFFNGCWLYHVWAGESRDILGRRQHYTRLPGVTSFDTALVRENRGLSNNKCTPALMSRTYIRPYAEVLCPQPK